MDRIKTISLERLHSQRSELRKRLARAWVRREPVGQIRKIEQRLRHIWTQLDAAELSYAETTSL